MANNNQNNKEEQSVDPKDPNYKGWKRVYEKNSDAAAVHPNHGKYLRYYKHEAPHNIVKPTKKAKGGLVSKQTFIARGCGKVMNKRRKKTKIY